MNNIKLNVGGRTFETTYDTLIKIPYFKNMFDGCDGELNEVIFVNRSPLIFEHVFAFILDPFHPYPKEYVYELDFYGIECKKLYDKDENIINCLEKKKKKCRMSPCANPTSTEKNYCNVCVKIGLRCDFAGCHECRVSSFSFYCSSHHKLLVKNL